MIGSPRTVAIFVPSMLGGGAERTMLNLARGISERGYPVDLVLAQAEGPFLAEVPNVVRLVDLEATRVLASLPALIRYLRREQPEAMLSAMGHANIVLLWARRLSGTPVRVVVSERINLSNSIRHAESQRARLMLRLMKHFYPWADGIVAVSKGVADDMAQVTGIPRDHIRVINNPVVTPELRAKARVPLEHPWFGGGQPPVLLTVGRLNAQKDLPTLIQAFAKVRQARAARLLILGEGEDRPELEALVSQLGLERDVQLPGFVENPYPYMARASLFVLCSRWEGLPGVLIEALYCGAPLISTDCPSGPREILADGKYGQLVPVGDVNSLAHSIETSLAGKMVRAPDESWRLFEQQIVTDRYLSLLAGH